VGSSEKLIKGDKI